MSRATSFYSLDIINTIAAVLFQRIRISNGRTPLTFATEFADAGKVHNNLAEATDYAYSGLIYRMFEFAPFSSILNTEIDVGLIDLRPARNIALFTQVINKFEYLHRISVLDSAVYKGRHRIDSNTELLFNLYLRLLYDGGITEYEDDAEYAPSGCVSFQTIHQSKGMEFLIVFVDSFGNIPRKS